MRWFVLLILLAVPMRAAPLYAEPLRIVTDIAPVQSIAKLTVGDQGVTTALIPAGASPHDYHMRPSEAQALTQADLVIWVGPALTGWLERPIETLAPKAAHLVLMDVTGTRLLPAREDAGLSHHDHDHDEDHGKDHTENDATPMDPHAWLDPQNAAVWSRAIADALGKADPENAGRYRQNAKELSVALEQLEDDLADLLEPHRDTPFLLLHDAFQYFEHRFEMTALAAVTPTDATMPGPARLSALRATLAGQPVRCAFAEPQAATDLLKTVVEGHDITIVTLDSMGDPDADAIHPYGKMMRTIAARMADCLAGT